MQFPKHTIVYSLDQPRLLWVFPTQRYSENLKLDVHYVHYGILPQVSVLLPSKLTGSGFQKLNIVFELFLFVGVF